MRRLAEAAFLGAALTLCVGATKAVALQAASACRATGASTPDFPQTPFNNDTHCSGECEDPLKPPCKAVTVQAGGPTAPGGAPGGTGTLTSIKMCACEGALPVPRAGFECSVEIQFYTDPAGTARSKAVCETGGQCKSPSGKQGKCVETLRFSPPGVQPMAAFIFCRCF